MNQHQFEGPAEDIVNEPEVTVPQATFEDYMQEITETAQESARFYDGVIKLLGTMRSMREDGLISTSQAIEFTQQVLDMIWNRAHDRQYRSSEIRSALWDLR
jgi:hypothetical protein